MSPKETYSLVLERAKHGALIDRCARIVYYIVISVAFVCAVFPFPATFFPREYFIEYFMVIVLGVPLGLLLLALAILAWLKRRLVTDEEMPRQSLPPGSRSTSQ